MAKFPFMQFFTRDWLGDPAVTQCEPATRGILFDWLCAMHELDRTYKITGTREKLAKSGRCSLVQCEAALSDLRGTNSADVTERGGVVTVINRRLLREYKARNSSKLRMKKMRSEALVTPELQPPLKNHISEGILKKTTTKLKGESDWNRKTDPIERLNAMLAILTPAEREIAQMAEDLLGLQWLNDAGKWINRITGRGLTQKGKAEPDRVRRVFAEVKSAIVESRISSTPAEYAEQIWKEFK